MNYTTILTMSLIGLQTDISFVFDQLAGSSQRVKTKSNIDNKYSYVIDILKWKTDTLLMSSICIHTCTRNHPSSCDYILSVCIARFSLLNNYVDMIINCML